jgi:hypothetical protein
VSKYLLNSAVITGSGCYEYRIVSGDEAVTWLRSGGWVSRIGYPATAGHIQAISGIRPPLSRETTRMQSGDEALVVRLKYRVQDPGTKGQFRPDDTDWEYGILTMK